MRSMTGYGSGTAESDGSMLGVEISSVNRKQQDIRIQLPKELTALERDIRSWLQERISRGAVSLSLNYSLGENDRNAVQRLDSELAVQTAQELAALAERAGINAQLSIRDLLAVPGIILEEQRNLPLDTLRPLAMAALETAFAEFDAMRLREGQVLLEDIKTRLATMQSAAARIRQEAQQLLPLYRDRLKRRAIDLGLELDADDERLVKEAVFLADRSDITEEVIRLGSHFDQFNDLLEASDPPGRSLEFLCQELHREINTIGAKSNGADIAENVLRLKSELGRVKEQSMNIE